jgi:hypothetical protein
MARVWREGDKCPIGPRFTSGGYDKWNWCSICTAIWDKKTLRCKNCNQMTRSRTRWK